MQTGFRQELPIQDCCSHQHDQNTITGRRLSSPCQAEGPQLRAVEATALPLRHSRATVGMVSCFSVIVNHGKGVIPLPLPGSGGTRRA